MKITLPSKYLAHWVWQIPGQREEGNKRSSKRNLLKETKTLWQHEMGIHIQYSSSKKGNKDRMCSTLKIDYKC
jgi:hypothetical protein